MKANAGAAGVDHQTIEMFERHLEANLRSSRPSCAGRTYRPQPVRRHWIPKPGKPGEKRPLGIPTVRDRVVQAAVRHVIEPIYEKDFAAHSYGFRPREGARTHCAESVSFLREGHTWVVDADLKSYFDTIPHEPLMERVRQKVSDGRVLELIERICSKPLDELRQWTPEGGTPQGAVLSPLLSNIYLDPLDHQMAAGATRWCAMPMTLSSCVAVKATPSGRWSGCSSAVDRRVAAASGEDPHRRCHGAEGFDFLGYHFKGGQRCPRKKSRAKLRETLRNKTSRTSGHSLKCIIENVNRTLHGWFEYFQHAHRNSFPRTRQLGPMRLRSLLRKRRGAEAEDADAIISAGRRPTLRSRGCTP